MRQLHRLCWLTGILGASGACSISHGSEPAIPATYVDVPSMELVFEELQRTGLAYPDTWLLQKD